MEEADHRFGFPSLVSLSPFSPISTPSSRRLSSHFTPNRPVAVSSAPRLAWVSLQGRIVNAEEASSSKAIGSGLSPEEAVAWELFNPIQRFLIVAVIGVAVAESKKNNLISQLKKSVDLRDQVLSSMQQKLDDLCEQVNGVKNPAGAQPNTSLGNNVESSPTDAFGCDKIKFIDCGCWHCDYHQNLFAGLMGNCAAKVSTEDEVLKYKMPLADQVEQDERRMSDLSDWASSVTSTADIQATIGVVMELVRQPDKRDLITDYCYMTNLLQQNVSAVDQDILNLKKECEEKDATITELTAIIQSTNMAGSKRTAELEDIIRRKNMTIVKLKKDITTLEQKLLHLTRLRRSSSSRSSSNSQQLPLMLENIIYDMDSNTSSSSSDSDSSPRNKSLGPVKSQVAPLQHSSNSHSCSDSNSDYSYYPEEQVDAVQIQETPVQNTDLSPRPTPKSAPTTARASNSSARSTAQHVESKSATPCKEKPTNQKYNRISSLRPKQLSAGGEFKKIRRRTQTSDAAPKKRWM